MSFSRHVLIYRVGQLGDTLMALPAIEMIAKKHPGSRLVLLTDRHATAAGYVSAWDVIAPTGWIDEVIFYEPRGNGMFGKIKQAVTLLFRLRRYRFDHIYNLALRTTQSAVRRDRFFFAQLLRARNYRGLGYVRYPPHKEITGHLPILTPEWQRTLNCVEVSTNKIEFRPTVPETARMEVDALLPSYDYDQSKRTIVFAPGSKMAAKRWSEARFTELSRRLLAKCSDIQILFVGGEEDFSMCERLCAAMGGLSINLAGKLSIYGSAALMEGCELYVGNDTGTMHLAAMVGVPCVAIFSARDYPGLWEPYGTDHVIIRKEIECSGCLLETCGERGNACLEMISVDEVYAAVLEKLEWKVNRKECGSNGE